MSLSVRKHYAPNHATVPTRNPVTAPLTYPAAAMPGDAVLTVRAHTDNARERLADLSFRFTDPGHIEITRH
jgi:hypothetical protein